MVEYDDRKYNTFVLFISHCRITTTTTSIASNPVVYLLTEKSFMNEKRA